MLNMEHVDETLTDFTFYTKSDAEELLARDCKDAQQIARLLMQDSKTLVSNIDTEIVAMASEAGTWALSINKKEYRNSVICSPYTTYVTYPLDELKKFNKTWVKVLVLINTVVMGLICRTAQMNRIVLVNNNLNTLLKHPNAFNKALPQLTKQLITRYPKRSVTFFRVNETINAEFFKALKESGYIVFPDRMAHVFFPDEPYMGRTDTKRDMKLLHKSNYTIVPHDELTEDDAKRFAELYRKLFIDKHSKRNPVYTEEYFRQAIRHHWHNYLALRSPEGRIDGFISWFMREGVMVASPMGYDSDIDRKVGLYRLLFALYLKEANEHQVPFNIGAGSDTFKSNRGSTGTMEYTAVYCKHLPFYRQIPWRIMRWACNKMLKKVMESSSL